jgi:hypothetical protein
LAHEADSVPRGPAATVKHPENGKGRRSRQGNVKDFQGQSQDDGSSLQRTKGKVRGSKPGSEKGARQRRGADCGEHKEADFTDNREGSWEVLHGEHSIPGEQIISVVRPTAEQRKLSSGTLFAGRATLL